MFLWTSVRNRRACTQAVLDTDILTLPNFRHNAAPQTKMLNIYPLLHIQTAHLPSLYLLHQQRCSVPSANPYQTDDGHILGTFRAMFFTVWPRGPARSYCASYQAIKLKGNNIVLEMFNILPNSFIWNCGITQQMLPTAEQMFPFSLCKAVFVVDFMHFYQIISLCVVCTYCNIGSYCYCELCVRGTQNQ